MLKEFKRQFGFLLFGVPKKKKTRIYCYDGKPVVRIDGDKVTYYKNKKKPRR